MQQLEGRTSCDVRLWLRNVIVSGYVTFYQINVCSQQYYSSIIDENVFAGWICPAGRSLEDAVLRFWINEYRFPYLKSAAWELMGDSDIASVGTCLRNENRDSVVIFRIVTTWGSFHGRRQWEGCGAGPVYMCLCLPLMLSYMVWKMLFWHDLRN